MIPDPIRKNWWPMFAVLVCVSALLVSCNHADSTDSAVMHKSDGREGVLDAAEILTHAVTAYGTASTYRESGAVTFHFSDGHVSRRPFSIAFVRDVGFRFDCGHFRDDMFRVMVQVDEDFVRLLSNRMAVEYDRRTTDKAVSRILQGFVAHLDGCTWHSVHLLLEDDPMSLQVFNFVTLARLPDTEHEGVSFYRIRGETTFGRVVEFWIDPSTFAIHRTLQRYTTSGQEIAVQIDSSSEFNVGADSLFLNFDVSDGMLIQR